MGKVAIIGGGVSGASCAKLLQQRGHEVVVYEKAKVPGGLIKCTEEAGNLFHRVGGHVFNSKDAAVSDWFWSNFDKETEFLFAERNASIFFGDRFVGYPIEQYLYELDKTVASKVIEDLLKATNSSNRLTDYTSFYDFLVQRFGETLCTEYFIPYNTKIWKMDLREMPLSWLDGKLPMPSVKEIIAANILRDKESGMVHSKFYYPKKGGSQFIIDRLLHGIAVHTSEQIDKIETSERVVINGQAYDAAIYTGDIRKISQIVTSGGDLFAQVENLPSNGTTTVLCSCDANPYSWVYIPHKDLKCHRIIMTGNFSPNNNSADLPPNRVTCTVEFVGEVSKEVVDASISQLPFNLSPISTNFEPNSYVIQNKGAREAVDLVRGSLKTSNIWLCGRFAEWEYYNMDAAILSAMNIVGEVDARITK
ncbi:FAD-dependent oxidoreductase [Asticcacaulis sp.]|uniref:protoporphyrinogen/coproporphyrinogen oxidase n=1 Tax=Asticcacaulis sp. TaxID=1872648 RepID=UPI00261FB585|nr:FAD-dependent oxidoreductase [Asticcacaulis sp.]